MKKNIIYLLLIIFSTFLNANEKVVLQLKWFHQFQFAGYYAAKEKGFYDEVGLDVEIKQRDLKYLIILVRLTSIIKRLLINYIK